MLKENPESVREQIHQRRWYHAFDFGNGLEVDGVKKLWVLEKEYDLIFKYPVERKTVIDVGAWDGAFSFEAKKRGALRVLATDHYSWSGPGWSDQDGFNLARQLLNLEVEDKDIDLPDITPESVGMFDVMFLLGVFYHLKNPLESIPLLTQVVSERLVLETVIDPEVEKLTRPAMVYYPDVELNQDVTNWWGPNSLMVIQLLKGCGFQRIEYFPSPIHLERGVFHAWKG